MMKLTNRHQSLSLSIEITEFHTKKILGLEQTTDISDERKNTCVNVSSE